MKYPSNVLTSDHLAKILVRHLTTYQDPTIVLATYRRRRIDLLQAMLGGFDGEIDTNYDPLTLDQIDEQIATLEEIARGE